MTDKCSVTDGWFYLDSVKRYEIDTLNRTSLGAFAAACTLVVIDLSTEVLDLNCAEFARLNALHTADTAV